MWIRLHGFSSTNTGTIPTGDALSRRRTRALRRVVEPLGDAAARTASCVLWARACACACPRTNGQMRCRLRTCRASMAGLGGGYARDSQARGGGRISRRAAGPERHDERAEAGRVEPAPLAREQLPQLGPERHHLHRRGGRPRPVQEGRGPAAARRARPAHDGRRVHAHGQRGVRALGVLPTPRHAAQPARPRVDRHAGQLAGARVDDVAVLHARRGAGVADELTQPHVAAHRAAAGARPRTPCPRRRVASH